jgi:hypothetical protein
VLNEKYIGKKKNTFSFMGQTRPDRRSLTDPLQLSLSLSLRPLPCGPLVLMRSTGQPPLLCVGPPVKGFTAKSSARACVPVARNPVATASSGRSHRLSPLLQSLPACAQCLRSSCPPRAAETSPHSIAPTRTLPLQLHRHNAGTSHSTTSCAQHATTGRHLP